MSKPTVKVTKVLKQKNKVFAWYYGFIPQTECREVNMKTYSKVSITISAIIMIAVGVIVLCNPAATLLSMSWLIGISALVSGISVLVFYFSAARGGLGAGTVLFAGVSDIILGLVFINHGYFIAELLAFFVGLWLTIFGVERFIRAFDLKRFGYDNWWLTLIIGAATAVLGVLSMATPMTSAILVSVVVGIGFIAYGIALLAILHALKKEKEETTVYYE